MARQRLDAGRHGFYEAEMIVIIRGNSTLRAGLACTSSYIVNYFYQVGTWNEYNATPIWHFGAMRGIFFCICDAASSIYICFVDGSPSRYGHPVLGHVKPTGKRSSTGG